MATGSVGREGELVERRELQKSMLEGLPSGRNVADNAREAFQRETNFQKKCLKKKLLKIPVTHGKAKLDNDPASEASSSKYKSSSRPHRASTPQRVHQQHFKKSDGHSTNRDSKTIQSNYMNYSSNLDKFDFSQQLSLKTYKEIFHRLLFIEERKCVSELAKRCDREYNIVFHKSEDNGCCDGYLAYIDAAHKDSDLLAHAKQVSVSSRISFSGFTREVTHIQDALVPHRMKSNFNAIIFRHTREDRQCFKIQVNEKQTCFKGQVTFEIDKNYFTQLHKAIVNVPDAALSKILPGKEQFHPMYASSFERPKYEKKKQLELDIEQLEALKMILNSDPAIPLIILGPFGTGKTRLLASSAYNIVCHGNKGYRPKVLLVSHHQSSADTLANLLSGLRGCIKVIRVTKLNDYKSSKGDIAYVPWNNLHHGELDNYDVVVTTLGTSCSLLFRVNEKFRVGYFTHILIDEAAQTVEPEAIIPLCFAGKKTKVVLAGDHCQVGPRLLITDEKAREYGLNISLLERLHRLYSQHSPHSNNYIASLIRNYRCVPEILMLPSSLYYKASLHSMVPNSKDEEYPLQFICSSVDNTDNSNDSNEGEAHIVVNEVKKYLRRQRHHKVCIITPSPTQFHILQHLVHKMSLGKVQVLKSTNVQGREFDAVFISTCEKVCDGQSVNYTKSLSSHYVFNTVITRSKYLVIAVGNPYLLIKTESNMIKTFPKTATLCWSSFLRKCFCTDQFKISENIIAEISEENYKKLMDFFSSLVYEDQYDIHNEFEVDDTILRAYTDAYDGEHESKKASKKLAKKAKEMFDNTFDDSTIYKDEYDCVLDATSFTEAKGNPLDTSNLVVQIIGRRNRVGALNGDTVTVGIFRDFIPNETYGRVIKVVERVSNLNFVCEVSQENSDTFYPIDNKNPGFKNFPACSSVYRKRHGLVKDIKEKRGPVIVYHPLTISEDGLGIYGPRVADVIDHSRALNMAFVIRFIEWNSDYIHAFGVVIKAYPKGYSYINSECLLSIIHSVKVNGDFEEPHIASANSCPGHFNSEGIPDIPFPNAFTIDPEDAINLDDVLTLSKLRESDTEVVYQFGVHIVDAAKHIGVDSDVDTAAFSKGTALYYQRYGRKKMIPMLPSKVLEELSLLPGNIRNVWSVTCKVHVAKDGEIIKVNTVQIGQSQIRSILKLSYEEAQGILDGTYLSEAISNFDDSNDISLKCTLDILYRFSLFFASQRLKSDAMYWYSSDDISHLSCWQAHKLIEECMIWANNEVAKKLYKDYPSGGALLRCQRPPEDKQLKLFKEFAADISAMSFNFSECHRERSNLKEFRITQNVLSWIKTKISEGKGIEVAGILMSDGLFPQLSVANSRKRVVSHKSKYCITEKDTPKKEYRHYSLCLDTYTHFTSPLRRYADILVQRLLEHKGDDNMKILEGDICKAINNLSTKASSFRRDSYRIEFSLSVMYNSKACLACIERNTNTKLTFSLLDITSVNSSTEVRIPCLGPFMPRNPENGHDKKYCWKIRISSLTKFSLDYINGATIARMSSERGKCANYFEAYKKSVDEKLEKVCYRIEFKDSCVSVDPEDWKYVLNFTKNPTSENLKDLNCFHRLQPQYLSNTSRNSSDIHIGTAECPFMNYILSLSLKETEIIEIWFSMRKKKCLPETVVQMIELSPLYRVCVQHNSHPALCFSSFFIHQASRPTYRNIFEYVELWKNVLLAEAAVASVLDSQVFIVRDAKLKWQNFTLCPASSECSLSYMTKDPVILEISKTYVESMSEYFKVKVGDLICARYGYTGDCDLRQVFHFVIRKVKKVHNIDDIDDLLITMDISKQENKVSKDMKLYLTDQKEALCELQIINMSRSYRRVYEGLLQLVNCEQRNNLVYHVAIHPKNLEGMHAETINTNNIMHLDPLALRLWNTRNPGERLNTEQIESIKLAMKNKFQLIRGPPGTGKSVTGAHIAYIFAMQNRKVHRKKIDRNGKPFVLYCGPSNKSVDVVFKKFYNFNRTHPDKKVDILRIYGRVVENNDYPALSEHHQNAKSNYMSPDWGKPFILHHLIRDTESKDEHIKNFITIDEEMKQIKTTSSIPSAMFCSNYKRAQNEAEESVLKRGYDVVLCTCNEVSGARLKKAGRASQCIVDEAGMASEPETLMPISHCEHVVLIGDHDQLQPVIAHRPASDNGLSISLFQRYAKHYNSFMYELCEQYRMHAEVCEFPSNQFYEGKLKTSMSVRQRQEKETKLEGFWPAGSLFPIVFCDVIGEENQEETGTIDGRRVGIESKHNTTEAKKAVEIVAVLCGKDLQVDCNQVAIVTPYSAQKIIIQKELKTSKHKVKVTTISESQGDEYGFVILCMVRSKPIEYVRHPEYICADKYWLEENLGFVTNKHQINVGITRSKYGLIIIGNKLLLSYNTTWKSLISHYEKNGCVVDGSKFPPR